MTRVRKFFSGSMVVVLISGVSAGCAGNGLKGMFSRNETSGYKTLEELEAERVEKEASAESEGSRFASWLPFGKTQAEPAEELASSSVEDIEEETQDSSLWRNPFRRQKTVESDPFLSKEAPEEQEVADKPSSSTSRSIAARGAVKEKAAAEIAKGESSDSSVRTVSNTASAEKPKPDDEVVERFEKHFAEKTTKAVDEAEQAAPLMTSTKDLKKAAAKVSSKEIRPYENSSEDQLLEFEKLLSEKKAQAAQKKKAATAAVNEAADEFADAFLADAASTEAHAESQSERDSEKTEPESSIDSFDSLLAAADTDRQQKPRPADSRSRKVKPVVAQEVEVADQEGLFGTGTRSASTGKNSSAAVVAAGDWASQPSTSDDIAWPDPRTGARTSRTAVARGTTRTDEDQFASMFSEAREQEAPPAATLPENPDSGAWSSAAAPRPAAALRSGKMHAVRAVSSARTVSEEAPVPAASPLAPVTADVKQTSTDGEAAGIERLAKGEKEAESTEVSAGSAPGRGLTIRMLVLLAGGIIVVALLFAPARKKPIHANQVPLQG